MKTDKIQKMKSALKTGLFLLLVLFISSCKNSSESGEARKKEDGNEKSVPVSVKPIKKQEVTRTLEYTANLIAFKEIHSAPASPGRISKINVEVGSRVSKGQVLVEMDKTQLTQALSQLQNARYNYRSVDTLYQLGSISEQQYEQVKTQYELAKSNVEFLQENTTLESPINGIVTGKYFEAGEMYSGAPNTPAGKAAVVSLMQINPLKAVVNVSQTYFPQMKEGMEAKIATDIYPDMIFEGNIYKVYPTIDRNTRTFQIEVLVKNNRELLRPGMFANIQIELKEDEALLVPAISVLKQEGTNNRYIFLNNNGNAKKVIVQIGKRYDDKIEIIAKGVQEGDQLIVEGQSNLMDGLKLNVEN